MPRSKITTLDTERDAVRIAKLGAELAHLRYQIAFEGRRMLSVIDTQLTDDYRRIDILDHYTGEHVRYAIVRYR